MALINCPECQAEVSDTAMKCPKCGVQLRKPKRGIFGKLFKWTFIAFNAFMAYALFSGMSNVSDGYDAATMSEAEQAGHAIGSGLGLTMLLGVWLAGAVILGLFVIFTRPKA